MSRIKKKPKLICRSWRWESEFDEQTLESIGNIQKKGALGWESANSDDLSRFIKQKHLFAICIRAVCMNGKDTWGVSEIIYPDQLIKMEELEQFYFDKRKEMLEGVQKQHIVDVGWVAQTYANFSQVDNDRWWQVGSIKATKERQELWRYYHNVVKHSKTGVAANEPSQPQTDQGHQALCAGHS